MTPAERATRARAAAYAAHAKHGRSMTVAARRAWNQRFERQVDPDGVLPEPERLRRAEQAKRAYMTSLSIKAAQARRPHR